MAQVIVYTTAAGTVSVCFPVISLNDPPNFTMADAINRAQAFIPADATNIMIVDQATLPNSPQEAWIISNGAITVDAAKTTALGQANALNQLRANDNNMFRALELLIDVLITKGTIVGADFPPSVRTLYQQRKALRTAAGVP